VIILDTNVISEVVRPAPDERAARWVKARRLEELHTTAVCQAEMLLGLALMPAGRRRDDLAQRMEAFFGRAFLNRVLPFDSAAAPRYAAIVARRREIGRPIEQSDAEIAAICRLHGATLATRDAGGFEGLEIGIVNPWAD
jgi:predicted nucleic acid-binding protein